MPYAYDVIARCYIGHTLMVSPRQGAEPTPMVINQLLDPGQKYVQCGRDDCQCSAPLVSTALKPADEETRLAVKKQKEKTDAQRRAAQVGTDPALLRAGFAELALENEKLKRAAAEMELENTKLKLAALENQSAKVPLQAARR